MKIIKQEKFKLNAKEYCRFFLLLIATSNSRWNNPRYTPLVLVDMDWNREMS